MQEQTNVMQQAGRACDDHNEIVPIDTLLQLLDKAHILFINASNGQVF